jgi:MFS family permease
MTSLTPGLSPSAAPVAKEASKKNRVPFTPAQRHILLALASAVGLRMLGLFLVLPVFTLYGLQFTKSRFLVGFAFGCYGLAMAITEFPLGRLSDRIGRRKVLLLGMTIFSLGSFLCAIPAWLPASMRIGELVFGRLVQGIGAITSTAFATVSDHIQEERRSTAMAVLGIPIGASFIIGVVAGPVIAGHFGTESLFWLTGALGFTTVWLLARYLPEAAPRGAAPASLIEVLRRPAVLRLDLCGFLMNTFMTSFWFFFPLIVTVQHHMPMGHYYRILIPMLLASGVTMFGFSSGADRGFGRELAATAFLILVVSAALLFHPSAGGMDPTRLVAVLIPGTLFLIGFTGLEPVLPSLVSRIAQEGSSGATQGSFQVLQYLGSFAGSLVAGGLSHLPSDYIMIVLMSASFAGFLLMLRRLKV